MRITFGIGVGYDKTGKRIDASDRYLLVNRAILKTAEKYGGCFITEGDGGWIDGKGELIVEVGIQITVETESNLTLGDGVAREQAKQHGEVLRELFNQTSVVVSVSPSFVYSVEVPKDVPTSPSLVHASSIAEEATQGTE